MQHLKQEELGKMSQHKLPIESDDGKSVETAYSMGEQFEAPSLEYLVIDLTLKASGYLFWQQDTQRFTVEDERKVDCLNIQATKNGEPKKFSFYFDLSELE